MPCAAAAAAAACHCSVSPSPWSSRLYPSGSATAAIALSHSALARASAALYDECHCAVPVMMPLHHHEEVNMTEIGRHQRQNGELTKCRGVPVACLESQYRHDDRAMRQGWVAMNRETKSCSLLTLRGPWRPCRGLLLGDMCKTQHGMITS
jgi:hypothetical protein